ncbi:Putative purine permease ybbY [Raoultella planticola]|uniref:Purine permease ybbY n=1 Tax=Raoultella planticola TaxID=575 RepID=A0A485DBP5_RAOPL|nr:Putative purine permease ybbY [Raoultella planticola]
MVVFPLNKRNTLAGFQWFFFIFCNTVVVPPTLQSAFQLPASALITLTQYGFITTGLACLAQALLGHRRAIMEGPTGLWWSTILTVTVGEAARGTPFASIASSLAVGIFLSAIFTIIIGVSGIGHRLAKLFSPTVMVFFMLLLGAQLTTIFFKGMLGLPFSSTQANVGIQLAPFSLALAVMMLVLGMIIFLPDGIARYALLFGTLVGWAGWYLLFSHSARHDGIRPDSLAVVSTWLRRGTTSRHYFDGAAGGAGEYYEYLRRYSRYRRFLSRTGRQQYSLPTKFYYIRPG